MKKAFVIGSLLMVLTLTVGGSAVSKGTDNGTTYEQLRLFTEVLSIVQNQYVDEVPPKDLIYSAIKGTLRGLDPHSSFLDPDSYREMQVETSGSFGGLGIEITLRDDVLTVVAPIETPPPRAIRVTPPGRAAATSTNAASFPGSEGARAETLPPTTNAIAVPDVACAAASAESSTL